MQISVPYSVIQKLHVMSTLHVLNQILLTIIVLKVSKTIHRNHGLYLNGLVVNQDYKRLDP